ncbi:MAG: adventurous gliding motility protein CglF [Deltaproteobacteria bacterium]|nr:adventurous gliding motility protein CglF [Deltaproteobacteria bacterium]
MKACLKHTFLLLLAFIVAVSLMWIPSSAYADDEDSDEEAAEGTVSEGGVLYKKKTVYDFEDDTITGDLTKPDGEFLSSREKTRHKSLIKIRDNFKEQILRSVNEL